MDPVQLKSLKKRLSRRLLAVEGVTGVGIRTGKLAVYVERDQEQLRRQVQDVLDQEAPGLDVKMVVTDAFRRQ